MPARQEAQGPCAGQGWFRRPSDKPPHAPRGSLRGGERRARWPGLLAPAPAPAGANRCERNRPQPLPAHSSLTPGCRRGRWRSTQLLIQLPLNTGPCHRPPLRSRAALRRRRHRRAQRRGEPALQAGQARRGGCRVRLLFCQQPGLCRGQQLAPQRRSAAPIICVPLPMLLHGTCVLCKIPAQFVQSLDAGSLLGIGPQRARRHQRIIACCQAVAASAAAYRADALIAAQPAYGSAGQQAAGTSSCGKLDAGTVCRCGCCRRCRSRLGREVAGEQSLAAHQGSCPP